MSYFVCLEAYRYLSLTTEREYDKVKGSDII